MGTHQLDRRLPWRRDGRSAIVTQIHVVLQAPQQPFGFLTTYDLPTPEVSLRADNDGANLSSATMEDRLPLHANLALSHHAMPSSKSPEIPSTWHQTPNTPASVLNKPGRLIQSLKQSLMSLSEIRLLPKGRSIDPPCRRVEEVVAEAFISDFH